MNKAVSFFMAILALVVMIPTAAFAQEFVDKDYDDEDDYDDPFEEEHDN